MVEHTTGWAGRVLLLALAFLTPPLHGQEPGPVSSYDRRARASGQTVTPVFEGWFPNPDGTVSLSFGYYSRNTEEVVDVPLGPDNYIEPRIYDGKQPTRFLPRPGDRGPGRGLRYWSVFTVRVPADYEGDVVWTLRNGGETFSIPGHRRHSNYEMDALRVDASGSTPPHVRLEPEGEVAAGPGGIEVGPLEAVTGVPLPLTVWATDDTDPPVTIRWFTHQGAGSVAFEPIEVTVESIDGSATTTALFSQPGQYVLRVRATNAATEFDRYCCWTNGYVRVNVNPDPDDTPTFTKDVAPILQDNCQACHRPGSIGPMSLLTYEEVRPWATVIQHRVQERMMPPWHLDGSVGVQEFKNDISLSDAEIETIVRWVEEGAPEGDPADLPPPVEWPGEAVWQLAGELGEPDLVIRSDAYTVRPNGQDQWWKPVVPTRLAEGRYIRGIELRPSYPLGSRVTHHVVLFSVVEGRRGLLTEWAMGKVGELMPEGTGRLLEAGAQIEWDVHYNPIGEEVPNDQVELAFWFHPPNYEPQFENRLQLFRADPTEAGPRGALLDLPPHSVRLIEGVHTMQSPVRIESFQAHMHVRGREMTLAAIYPDGRRETISKVDRFQHHWQISYKFADDVMPLLPTGTQLVITAVHDNTADNPNNPDPNLWVGFGRRTVDEMAHAWIGITYLDEESYEVLVAERAEAAHNQVSRSRSGSPRSQPSPRENVVLHSSSRLRP